MSENLIKNSYINFDYDTILQELIDYFKNDEDSPLKDYNFESSNLYQLMKILAYATHLSLFHTSVALNEMYFSTARLRKNLVKQLSAYGYTPRRTISSHKYLTISNSYDYEIMIPEFTEFTAAGSDTTDEKKFYNIESYTVPANGTKLITVYQSLSSGGRITQNFNLIYENNLVKKIRLDIQDLAQNYFKVETVESGETVSWVQYNDLDTFQNELSNAELTLLPEENIYFLDEVDTGYKLHFSRTGIGAVPNPDDGKTLTIKYMESDGTLSNNIPTSVFSFSTEIEYLTILQDTDLLASASTGVSSGGQDKETIDELRENVITVFNSQNRAVTEYDYTKLGKYNELIGSTGDIQVYGGEKHSTGARLGKIFVVTRPANDEQFFFSTAEKSELTSYFLKYCLAGMTPIVQNPHYINAIIDYDYTFKTLISNTDEISLSLNDMIKSFFVSKFGETIYVPQLSEELNKVYGVESAYIKASFKIVFDTLSELLGTYKIIPISENDINDFINDDGSFYEGYLYGFTDDNDYTGTNYGTLIFVNTNSNFAIVEQSSGVNNTNFEYFSKGEITTPAGSSYINTRKSVVSINYEPLTSEKYLYLYNTDGFTLDNYLISNTIGTGNTTALIYSINKKGSGNKHTWLQVDALSFGTSSGTSTLVVGEKIINTTNILGTIQEVDLTNNRIFVNYINGSDYTEGQDFDIGTSYSSPGTFKITKRSVLGVSGLMIGTTRLVANDCIINADSILGTIESVGTSAGTATISVRYSNIENYENSEIIQYGTTWTAGTGAGLYGYTITIGSGSLGIRNLTNGTSSIVYQVHVNNISSIPFSIGTTNVEPGDSWGFNTIKHIVYSGGSGTDYIEVNDPLSGITIGDTICTNIGSRSTVVTNVTSNTLTVSNSLGFGTGNLLHPGSLWSSILYSGIYKIDNVYNTDITNSLVLNNAINLGTSKYLVQPTGKAVIASIGTGYSGTSYVTIQLTNGTGYFTEGTLNIHQTETGNIAYEPLYTLNGNIEDFSTSYIIEYDNTDLLKYFVNKLDASETGLLDASPTENEVNYAYVFNTTETLDKDNLNIKLKYGTSALNTLITQQNTKYDSLLKLDSVIYNGTTSVGVGDYVTIQLASGTKTAYVYDVTNESGINYINARFNTGSIVIPSGTSNNIIYGTVWDGTGTNRILEVVSTTTPEEICYYSNGTTTFLAKINVTTGNVYIKRALSTTAKLISTGTNGGDSIDYSAKTITLDDSTGFINPGGTSSATVYVWNNEVYSWVAWEYTENDGTTLTGINSIPSTITNGMLMIQDTENLLQRVEFYFKNKIDKLKLGNRSLFYTSDDLINEL